MNRQIKFRAWDKDKKEMLISVERNITKQISLGGGGYDDYTRDFSDFLDNDNYIVMQFTGLLDKNGLTEIYEGDVIECYQQGETMKGKVVFEKGCFFIKFINGQKAWVGGAFIKYNPIIIGNIFENPDLIK